jgi:hypothetical protein
MFSLLESFESLTKFTKQDYQSTITYHYPFNSLLLGQLEPDLGSHFDSRPNQLKMVNIASINAEFYVDELHAS